MMALIKWCIKAGIAGVASIILLSLFTLVYSNSGGHITNKSQATDYCWEPDQYKANMTEGFSWLWMDADGFNNEIGFSDLEKVDILLMGSSHMEAVNVKKMENTGALLNQLIPDCTTYNIGVSGHTIYHCVNDLDNAISYYSPTRYVIIETDRIQLDTVMMEQVLNGKFSHIVSYDSGLLYAIQKKIPAVLPVYRQIENWRMVSSKPSVDTEDIVDSNEEELYAGNEAYREVLSGFLNRIKSACGDRKPIILYHPSTRIDETGRFLTEDTNVVNEFKELCEENEVYFIDMEKDFQALYEEDYILAHGFTNTAAGQGHLNRYGHLVIAERLFETIKEIENGTE